jgi:hypothetical protein
VVQIAVQHVIISTEALITFIIIMIDPLAPPSIITLDAEMVVAFSGQFAIARSGLQHALRQRDAGGNAKLIHLTDGYFLLTVEIVLEGFIPRNSMGKGWEKA